MSAVLPLRNSLRHFDFSDIELLNMFHSGHTACPGCGEALAIKFLLNALGPKTLVVALPSCLSAIAGSGGQNSYQVPNVHMVFAGGASAAAGLSRALTLRGEEDVTVCVLGGDGGTYDIGLQGISGAAERDENILYICLDNEGYMNTGAQKSSATPLYAATATTRTGKRTPKKNIVEILAAHGVPYVATATVGFPDDLQRKVRKAKTIKGFKFIDILSPCLPGWGMADDISVRASRLAVETRYWPLYEVEGGVRYVLNRIPEGLPIERFLELQERFRHLNQAQIAAIQSDVDRRWMQLCARAGIAPEPPARATDTMSVASEPKPLPTGREDC